MNKHIIDEDDEKMLLSALYEEEWSDNKYCREFENMYASYIGMKYAVVTANCTYAFKMALRSIGIKERDEIIVPGITWPSMIIAILEMHAVPVIVDITDQFQMLTDQVRKKITVKTRAILATHLYGFYEDVCGLRDIIKGREITIIEDFAHASGYIVNGKKLGSYGDIAVTSFNSKKVLACGEGGCLLTNSKKIYDTICAIKEVDEHPRIKGQLPYNFLISEFQAALLISQLRKLDNILAFEERNAAIVHKMLKHIQYIDSKYSFSGVDRRVYYSFTIFIYKDIDIVSLCDKVNKICGKFVGRIYIPLSISDLFIDNNYFGLGWNETPNANWMYKHCIRFHHSFLLSDTDQLIEKVSILISELDKMNEL